MMDDQKLNLLTEDWVKEIISQVADHGSPLLDGTEVVKILQLTQKMLEGTDFTYLAKEDAKIIYGDEISLYLKPQGLPCVKLDGAKDKTYIKEILKVQFKLYEDLSKRTIKIDEAMMSTYVYYSITAHLLCTMV